MSKSVLDFARSVEPGFKDVSDDELTQFIGETKPEFLQDPDFARQFDQVQAKSGKPPRLVNDQPEGIAKRAYRAVRESGPVTAILGPTERQTLTEGVPDETGQVQYKPQGSLVEQKGLIPGAMEGLSTPLKEIPKIPQQDNKASQIAAGVGNVGIGFANFMQSFLGVATMGLGGEVKAARETLKATDAAFQAGTATAEELAIATKHAEQVAKAARVVSGAFAADMGSKIPASVKSVKQAIESGTVQDITEAGVGAAANLLLTGAAAKHAIKGEGAPKITEPEVTKAAQDAVVEAKPAESVEVQDQAAAKVADHTAVVAEEAELPETASVVAEMAKKDLPKTEPVTEQISEPTVKPDLQVEPVVKEDLITEPIPQEARAEVESSIPATSAETSTESETSPSPEASSSAPVAPPEVPPVQPEAPPVIKPENVTSIQNAYVDSERAKRGLPPASEVGRRAWGEVWDQAEAKEAQDPDSGQRLVASLLETPRAVTDLEDAQLLREQIRAQTEYDAAVDAVNKAKTEGDDVALADAKSRLETARDQVQAVYDAGKAAGTETGRGLNARKMLADENFEPSRLEARARAAKGGEKLSETEQEKIKAARDEWVKARDEYDKVQNEKAQQAAQDIFDRVIQEIRKETEAAKEAKTKGASAKDYWKNLREQALERERERRGRAYAIDPVSASLLHLKDEAIIGASHIAEKVIDFAEWSKRMIADLGEEIRPRLQEIYNRSKAYHDQINKEFETESKKGKKAPKVEKTPGQVLDDAKVEGGITKKVIFDLARAYVRQGMTDLGPVMDKVTADLKPLDPTLDARKVRDIFSDYGKLKFPSKAEDLRQLREFRALAQATSALEDVQSGKAPSKSGMQRDKPTQKVREAQRKVQQALKEFGIKTVDPATQLKTSLDRVKTSLRNQIEDLEKQISTGEKTPRKKGVEYDQEAKDLKARRDALREQLQAIEGKPEMSNEQRNKIAVAAAKRSLEEYERRIREKDFSERQKPNREPSPELAEIRSQRDAAKEMYETLRDGPKKTADQIARERLLKAINKRADALEEKLRTQDYGKPPKKAPLRDEQIDAARARVERAKDKIEEEILKIKLAERTTRAKLGDLFVDLSRLAKLSGLAILPKLGLTAATRILFYDPLLQLTMKGLSQVPGIRQIAKRAPIAEPIGVKNYIEAVKNGVVKGVKDAPQIFKTGKSDLDVLYSDKRYLEGDFGRYVYATHTIMKHPAKMAAYEVALAKNLKFYGRLGDIENPLTMAGIMGESAQEVMKKDAYDQGLKSVFMDNNAVNTEYRKLLKSIERRGELGEWTSRLAQFNFPVVKVATNLVLEGARLSPENAMVGIIQTAKALQRGIDSLPPEKANEVMERLSKGVVGTGLLALGFYAYKNIGGFYQRANDRPENDVKPDEFRVFGVTLPHALTHHPLFLRLAFGSTAARVANSIPGSPVEKRASEALMASYLGLAKEQPFVKEIADLGLAIKLPHERHRYVGNKLKGMVPSLVQVAARLGDKQGESPKTISDSVLYPFREEVKRNPETTLDYVKMAIPGLRNTVPR